MDWKETKRKRDGYQGRGWEPEESQVKSKGEMESEIKQEGMTV